VTRPGGKRPIYSALNAGSSILRVCSALSIIEREWPRIAGQALAARSSLVSFEDGILVISVDGQAALQDMNFKKNAILKEIRSKARLKLNDLKIETGRPASTTRAANPTGGAKRRARAPRIDLDAEEALKNEILAQHEDLDPKLAATIARCRLISEQRTTNRR
jgi:hypothetical protein